MSRVLLAGVGYRNLRDLSLGPLLIDRLQKDEWPDDVDVEDLSYGPIAIMHALDERPPYERMVFVSGARRGTEPGEISTYRWSHELPHQDEIQQRVAEAAAGVVDLENLLVVATYFGKLPADVRVFEVEVADDSFGESLTPAIEAVLPRLIGELRATVEGP